MQGRRNNDFFKAVGRHFVTLSYCYTPPGKSRDEELCDVVSGFLIEVNDVWFYVTAGHILDTIKKGLRAGGTFDAWRLDDQTAGNNFRGAAVPYDFNIEHWIVLRDDALGIDYAAVVLEGLIRKNLEVGGAKAISKSAWGLPPNVTNYDQCILVGIPKETVAHHSSTIITARISMIPIEPTSPPASAGQTVENMFFGVLNFASTDSGTRPTDIAGMSGGPIFATQKFDESLKYWIVGVQSGWYPSIATVSACPFSSFGLVLEDLFEKNEFAPSS